MLGKPPSLSYYLVGVIFFSLCCEGVCSLTIRVLSPMKYFKPAHPLYTTIITFHTISSLAALESKVTNLEEQLSAEAQERMLAAKANRNLEKKIKELLMQIEDERRHADQYREQNEKTNGRMKAMRRQLDEAEEEISREKALRRNVTRT